ncbi:hypothetical protein [Nocardia brasiliensis]|uniref:hypothetical protein n=1 Tax=Nocardia brasiliensis TaxID=37326 RepID=UPI003D8DBA7D
MRAALGSSDIPLRLWRIRAQTDHVLGDRRSGGAAEIGVHHGETSCRSTLNAESGRERMTPTVAAWLTGGQMKFLAVKSVFPAVVGAGNG